MSELPRKAITVSCSCGRVELEAAGDPITSIVCYCDDCQNGARQIAALRNAQPVLDPDGGTAYILYRKDRVSCTKGAELLRSYKLKDTSVTNRMVASCCNSAMFLKFDRGPHWYSLYGARSQGDVLPVQFRIQTKFKPPNGDLPSDAPSYATYPVKFLAKLIASRIAMLIHR
jgi:hypothetical protein